MKTICATCGKIIRRTRKAVESGTRFYCNANCRAEYNKIKAKEYNRASQSISLQGCRFSWSDIDNELTKLGISNRSYFFQSLLVDYFKKQNLELAFRFISFVGAAICLLSVSLGIFYFFVTFSIIVISLLITRIWWFGFDFLRL